MDASYLTARAYIQKFPCTSTGSPSPPLSLYSEPIQLPMSDGSGTRAKGLQLKTTGIQLLNKTMGDPCKKKNVVRGHNLTPRVEPPDMINFFQTSLPFPDYLSDSGDGSVKGVSESLQFKYSPSKHVAPHPKSNPSSYHKFDSAFWYPQCELQMQMPWMPTDGYWIQPIQQQPALGHARPVSSAWGCPASMSSLPYGPSRMFKQQPQSNTQDCIPRKKVSSTENDTKSKRKPTTAGKKQRLITSVKTTPMKKERNKNNVLQRKYRKQVQLKNKSLHKTELCTHWSLTSSCTFKGKCYFAHGIDDLKKRIRQSNFKTRPCSDCPTKKGRCLFGSRCNYCHPGEAIRRAVGSTYFDRDYYRTMSKEFGDNEYPLGIFI